MIFVTNSIASFGSKYPYIQYFYPPPKKKQLKTEIIDWLSSEFAFGSLRDELRALLILKALAKARRALAKGLEACVRY